jgi:hypothetical protein
MKNGFGIGTGALARRFCRQKWRFKSEEDTVFFALYKMIFQDLTLILSYILV